jgi:ubiquinone/menaquinone biosynthesis C-methylase UbiE
MPYADNKMDKVLSNCVLNLVPEKTKAFNEIIRVLKPGGSFCISDVVTVGQLPDAILKDAEMYAGCVAGAITKEDYMTVIRKAGFSEIQLHKEKEIVIPDEILRNHLTDDELNKFKQSQTGIFSITVSAKKA